MPQSPRKLASSKVSMNMGDASIDSFEKTTDHTARTCSDLSSQSMQSSLEEVCQSPSKKKKKLRSSSRGADKKLKDGKSGKLSRSKSSKSLSVSDHSTQLVRKTDEAPLSPSRKSKNLDSPRKKKSKERRGRSVERLSSAMDKILIVDLEDETEEKAPKSPKKSKKSKSKSRRSSSRSRTENLTASPKKKLDTTTRVVSAGEEEALPMIDRRMSLARTRSTGLLTSTHSATSQQSDKGRRNSIGVDRRVGLKRAPSSRMVPEDRRKALNRTRSGHDSMRELLSLQRSTSNLNLYAQNGDEESNQDTAPSAISLSDHSCDSSSKDSIPSSPVKKKNTVVAPMSPSKLQRPKLKRESSLICPSSPSKTATQYFRDSTKDITGNDDFDRQQQVPKTISGLLHDYDDIVSSNHERKIQ